MTEITDTKPYLISKKRWFKRNDTRVNPILKITSLPEKSEVTSIMGSPSPVKLLFPSISTFNLPSNSNSIPSTPKSTISLPPPQFAIDPFKRDAILKRLKPRKPIEKAYPSALDTYLFDDMVPPNGQGIRPVRLLIERLEAWYILSKRLLYHFELLASVETQVSKTYRQLEDMASIFPTTTNKPKKTERILQIHFNFNAGIKSMCDAWQKYHADTTLDHAELATFLRNEAIPTLRNIKHELRWMIESIKQDDRLSLSTLTRLKREAAKRLKLLDRQLIFFDEHPYYGSSKKDPWLMNAGVVKQMIKVYRQENKIHETVLRLQREILVSEEQIVLELKQVCEEMYQIREASNLGLDKGIEHIMSTMNQIESDWNKFQKEHQDHLISENAAFRHPDHLQYPNHSHPLLQPIFAARMERKSKFYFQKKWNECIYVLTEAGFLHEYTHSSQYPAHPSSTIYVPHYKVSSLSTHLHHNLVFELQPHTASRNMNQEILPKRWCQSTSRLGIQNDRFTWTLRAKSADDMETWIQHLTKCSERYQQPCANLVTSHPNIVISPVEDTLQEETNPAEEPAKEVEETPAEETTKEEETLVEETPVEEAPVKETPIEEAPVEAPIEETTTEEVPMKETSVEEIPTDGMENVTPETETIQENPAENAVIE